MKIIVYWNCESKILIKDVHKGHLSYQNRWDHTGGPHQKVKEVYKWSTSTKVKYKTQRWNHDEATKHIYIYVCPKIPYKDWANH